VPADLVPPGVAIIAALALDFLQYALGSVMWAGYNRYLDFQNRPEEERFYVPPWMNWPTVTFFWGKIIMTAIAYVLILFFLKDQLVAT
jgi:hypothetical protein